MSRASCSFTVTTKLNQTVVVFACGIDLSLDFTEETRQAKCDETGAHNTHRGEHVKQMGDCTGLEIPLLLVLEIPLLLVNRPGYL